MELGIAALEEELLRLRRRLVLASAAVMTMPVLAPVARAAAMKSFDTCFEHAARLMASALVYRDVAQPKQKEPFRMMVARANRAGMVEGREWRRYRAWRNESVHRYTDSGARRMLVEMEGFMVAAEGLVKNARGGLRREDS